MMDSELSKGNNPEEAQKNDGARQEEKKVELDIEDAPFLSDEPEEAEDAALEDKNKNDVQDNPEGLGKDEEDVSSGNKKKKLVIFGSIIITVLLVIGVSLWLFFFNSEPVQDVVSAEPKVIVVPSKESISGKEEYKLIFEPFMVEQRDSSSVKFLEATFIAISDNERVIKEAQSRELVLRDAIYYYLRNKKHEYLLDTANRIEIKNDLLDIVNGYLSSGKMGDILLENYLLR